MGGRAAAGPQGLAHPANRSSHVVRRACLVVACLLITVVAAPVDAVGSRPPPAIVRDGPATPVVVVLDGRGVADRSSRFVAADITRARSTIRSQARGLGIVPDLTFGVIGRAVTTTLTPRERARVERMPGVVSVQDDQLQAHAHELVVDPTAVAGRPGRRRKPRQGRSLIIERLGVRSLDPLVGTGRRRGRVDADVAVVDTGVSPHPDLKVAGGKDCSRSGSWKDGYGHGTAVAGIIAAKDDHKGVVGLAPGARVWSVRVFDGRARSRPSNHLCALDWIAGKRHERDPSRPFFEAVNMSLTFRAQAPLRDLDGDCARAGANVFQRGICRIVRQGTVVVGAAGNQGRPVGDRMPAALSEAIGVSAMSDFDGKPGGDRRDRRACGSAARERDDRFASYSNNGGAIDLVAPGTCIWTTYLGGSYTRATGTSFAAPMVTAAVLWYLRAHPNAKPGQVRQALVHAGKRDYQRGRDRDAVKEPRVDLRALQPPPVFELVGREPIVLRRGGSDKVVTIGRRRLHGHTARIALSVEDRPDGVSARLDGDRLRMEASDSARRGEQVVVIRATDGEIHRTLRVPLLILEPGDPVPTPTPEPTPEPSPEPSPEP